MSAGTRVSRREITAALVSESDRDLRRRLRIPRHARITGAALNECGTLRIEYTHTRWRYQREGRWGTR